MKHVESYAKLAAFGRTLLEHRTLEKGLPVIAAYAKEVIGAERCSIFVHNEQSRKLWTTLSDGVEKIVLNADEGIAGSTVKERKPIIVNDPYKDPRFYPKIDHETGYITKNIASVPVFSSTRKIIGVLQLLNKESEFDEEDARFMIFFAHYVSGYLELSCIFRKGEDSC